MTSAPRTLIAIFVVLIAWDAISPAAAASVPGHCKPGEVNHFSGRMGKLNDDTLEVVGQKILSLCADPDRTWLEYRFGPPGMIELSFAAPRDGTFGRETQEPSHRAMLEALYFRRGTTTYAIVQCFGMHCGVHDVMLKVCGNGKLLASLDNDRDRSDGEIYGLDSPFGNLSAKIAIARPSGLDLFQ